MLMLSMALSSLVLVACNGNTEVETVDATEVVITEVETVEVETVEVDSTEVVEEAATNTTVTE